MLDRFSRASSAQWVKVPFFHPKEQNGLSTCSLNKSSGSVSVYCPLNLFQSSSTFSSLLSQFSHKPAAAFIGANLCGEATSSVPICWYKLDNRVGGRGQRGLTWVSF